MLDVLALILILLLYPGMFTVQEWILVFFFFLLKYTIRLLIKFQSTFLSFFFQTLNIYLFNFIFYVICLKTHIMFIIISSKIQILKLINQIKKIKMQLIISNNNIIKSRNKKTHFHKKKSPKMHNIFVRKSWCKSSKWS